MKTSSTLPCQQLAEKALKIFVLHYYSLDWILHLLLERRFIELHSLSKFTEKSAWKEEDLLFCVKIARESLLTARGLDIIEKIIQDRDYIVDGRVNNNFNSLSTNYCSSARYRMSLFAMADKARERHHDDLASLWTIAATANLHQVSAYQAYAAAKEEESRLLNYIDMAEYWKAEKCYVGDITNVEIDQKLMVVQKRKESQDKDQAFRNYLMSQTDKSLYEMINTSDLRDHMFLSVWCSITSHRSKRQVSSSMWKLASELYKTQQKDLARQVIANAFEFEDTVKQLSLVAASYQSDNGKGLPITSFREKAAAAVEYAIAKIKSSITLLTLTDLKGQMETLKKSILRMKDVIKKRYSYYNTLEKCLFSEIVEFDYLLKDVFDLLPVLITYPDHSFPDLMMILQEKCEQLRHDAERYVEITDAHTRCRIEGNQPSPDLLKQVDLSDNERSKQTSLLRHYQRFLKQIKFALHAQTIEFEINRRDVSIQATRAFVDEMHTMHVEGNWSDSTRRQTCLEKYETILDQIHGISNKTEINFLIAEISLQIITYSKHQHLNKKEILALKVLMKAKDAMLRGKANAPTRREDSDEERKRKRRTPEEHFEMGKRFHELANHLLKVEGIKVKQGDRGNELFLRLITYFDLTVKSILCLEEFALAENYDDKKMILFHGKADRYFKAIEAFDQGDVDKALAFEQEASNIEIE